MTAAYHQVAFRLLNILLLVLALGPAACGGEAVVEAPSGPAPVQEPSQLSSAAHEIPTGEIITSVGTAQVSLTAESHSQTPTFPPASLTVTAPTVPASEFADDDGDGGEGDNNDGDSDENLIVQFTADTIEAVPGDTITLSWTTRDTITVTLYHMMSTGQLGHWWAVPLDGSFEYEIPVHEKNVVRFALFAADDEGKSEMATTSVILRCLDSWFFENPPEICPAAEPMSSAGAIQDFEAGQMIWIAEEDMIYVLFEDGNSPNWNRYLDHWQVGDPESDASLAAPVGLQQPIRGFGLIWREEPRVRERVGWATGAEMGFETTLQRTSYAKYNETFIQMPGSEIWRLLPERSGWEVWAGPR